MCHKSYKALNMVIFLNVVAQVLDNLPVNANSNAIILNPSFSLALSRYLLTITTPSMTVHYAHVCLSSTPTDKRG